MDEYLFRTSVKIKSHSYLINNIPSDELGIQNAPSLYWNRYIMVMAMHRLHQAYSTTSLVNSKMVEISALKRAAAVKYDANNAVYQGRVAAGSAIQPSSSSNMRAIIHRRLSWPR